MFSHLETLALAPTQRTLTFSVFDLHAQPDFALAANGSFTKPRCSISVGHEWPEWAVLNNHRRGFLLAKCPTKSNAT